MRTVNCYANVFGNIGYAVHGRNFFAALNRHVDVCLIPKYGLPEIPADSPLNTMLDRLLTIDLNAVAITLDYPDQMFRFGGRKRVGSTVFETDVLSAPAIHQLKQLDQVWVPSQWGLQVLVNNGLPQELIRVVPEGVDPSVYKGGIEPFPELIASGGFRFLAVGKWEERKGVRELLQAFDLAFSKEDSVSLVVYFLTEVNALQNINVKTEVEKLNLKNREKVTIVDSRLQTEHDMARLYNSCNAFVSASKAEGWGLPLMEAMACGLPVIATFYSGPTEYLTEQNSYPFKVECLEDVHCPVFFPEKGRYGKWARIDIDLLAQKMRHVFLNQGQTKEIGAFAAREVGEKWTWGHAAKKAMSYLSEFEV